MKRVGIRSAEFGETADFRGLGPQGTQREC